MRVFRMWDPSFVHIFLKEHAPQWACWNPPSPPKKPLLFESMGATRPDIDPFVSDTSWICSITGLKVLTILMGRFSTIKKKTELWRNLCFISLTYNFSARKLNIRWGKYLVLGTRGNSKVRRQNKITADASKCFGVCLHLFDFRTNMFFPSFSLWSLKQITLCTLFGTQSISMNLESLTQQPQKEIYVGLIEYPFLTDSRVEFHTENKLTCHVLIYFDHPQTTASIIMT